MLPYVYIFMTNPVNNINISAILFTPAIFQAEPKVTQPTSKEAFICTFCSQEH